MPAADGTLIAGLDGCRRGWVLAALDHVPVVEPPEIVVIEDLTPVVERIEAGEIALAAIDIPIGLADEPRPCDREARRLLGERRSTVFAAPVPAVLDCDDYPGALVASRAASGRGLSIQSWNLVPAVREADRAVRSLGPGRLHETSPELSFLAMTGAPLVSKHRPEGREARSEALADALGWSPPPTAPPGARPDDVLDALAVAWSAHRIAAGTAEVLGQGDVGEDGIPMTIRF